MAEHFKAYEQFGGNTDKLVNGKLRIAEGGTKSGTASDARDALNMAAATDLGVVNGIAVRPDRALVPGDFAAVGIVASEAHVEGPTAIAVSQTQTFKITNYDMSRVYDVRPIRGEASIVSDTITYKAPATLGTAGFYINGRAVNLALSQSPVRRPLLTAPLNGSIIKMSAPVMTGDAFYSVTQGDVHKSSRWQVSTDVLFNNLIFDSGESTTNLTSITIVPNPALVEGTTYYGRVRYTGNDSTKPSPWSVTNAFAASQGLPEAEVAIVRMPSLETSALFGGKVAISPDGQWLAVSRSNTSSDDNVYIYKNDNGSWVFNTKIRQDSSSPYTYPSDFGYSLAFSRTDSNVGLYLAVGAPGAATIATVDITNNNAAGGLPNSGVVYFYRFDGGWTYHGFVTSTGQGTRFGTNIGFANDEMGRLTCVVTGLAANGDHAKLYTFNSVSNISYTRFSGNYTTTSTHGKATAISANSKYIFVSDPSDSGGVIYVFETSAYGQLNLVNHVYTIRVNGATALGESLATDSTGLKLIASDRSNNKLYVFESPSTDWSFGSMTPTVTTITGDVATAGTLTSSLGTAISPISSNGTFLVSGIVDFNGVPSHGIVHAFKFVSRGQWQYLQDVMPYPRAINIRGFNASPGVSTIKYDTDAATSLPNGEYSFSAKTGAAKATITLKGGDGSQYYVPGSPGTQVYNGPSSYDMTFQAYDGSNRRFEFLFNTNLMNIIDWNINSSLYFDITTINFPPGWASSGCQAYVLKGTQNSTTELRLYRYMVVQNNTDYGCIPPNQNTPWLPWMNVVGSNGGIFYSDVSTVGYTTVGGTPGYYQPTSGSNSTAITAEKSLTANAGYGQGSVGSTVTADFDLKINGFYGNSISVSDNMSTLAIGCSKYSFDLTNSGAVYIFR